MSAGKGKQAQTYSKYLEQSTASLKAALGQYEEYKGEYHEIQQTLAELPTEIEYDAMVPVGPLAFFPGKLVSTNEILVLLGDNWFVERSAAQAAAIARRREQFVDEKIAEVAAELRELERRHTVLAAEPGAQQLGRELGGGVVNAQGEQILDIKEQLDESQLPAFADDRDILSNDHGIPGDDHKISGDADDMQKKRERMIRALSADAPAAHSALSPADRAALDALAQLESSDSSQSESDEPGRESDGDAFSDDDRAHAARDDDEDDFNAGAQFARRRDGSDDELQLDIVERPRPPRGILKSPVPTSRLASPAGKQRKKSVSFNATAVSYAGASHELLDDGDGDEDIARVARLLGQLQAPPTTESAPLISVISEDAPPVSVISNDAPRFKPNVKAARAKSAGAKPAAPPAPKAAVGGPAASSQPLRRQVVERGAAAAVTHDDVDEDMHAREIALAYTRMRRARLASGSLDGAAELAEQVLAATPGVTLVDAPARTPSAEHNGDFEHSEDFERIELPADTSHSTGMGGRPPEVVHVPTAPKATDPATPKPKMSRFKAQRLGLS
ncbi:hypothetical protein H4S02_005221 [Coemansia sp. RSA 2611]|nr:hypothetical protein IWW54_002289 [Coemansia sp. RSA 2705]KAJ2383606.1 hypothetical protein H4S02_005221 [Coemansia sp. RSA 2611]